MYFDQPTTQPTELAVLHDLRVFRQSPRCCKSLKNLMWADSHGGSRRFESCSAHQKDPINQLLAVVGRPIKLGRPMKPHHLVRGTLSEAEITLRIAAARSLRERGASPTT